jgi:radical SAM protein with 4Fe4S-binding SPASM domain
VDGINQETYARYRINGSFDKVIQNVAAIAAAKRASGASTPELQFKYILFKHNEMYKDQAHALSKQLGMDSFRVEPCTASDYFPPETVKKYMGCGMNARAIQRLDYIDYGARRVVSSEGRRSPHCLHVFGGFSVLVDGSVLPCCAATRFDSNFGNLRHESFASIWNSTPYRTFRHNVLINNYAVPACRQCSMLKVNFGRLFDGTILEYAKAPEPTDNILRINDLAIEQSYAQELLAQGKVNELDYFVKSGCVK